jgi:nucleoside-diphosphate-sugar epimerase
MREQPISVLVTGSAGRIGRSTCRALAARGHRVRGFDIVPTPDANDAATGDLTDMETVRRAMKGINAVVHLAATPDEADFMTQLLPNNIVALYNVMEAAREAKVSRLVLTSTGQVVSGYDWNTLMTTELLPRPRNWYASTKVFAETIGQAYAYRHGMSVVVIRPGWCPRTQEHAEALARSEFGPDVYFSPNDAGRCFACAATAKIDEPYVIFFATSRPARRARFDIEAAQRLIGYEPKDTWPEGL